MLNLLKGFAERLNSYVKEPLTALGSAVQEAVYADEYVTIDYPLLLHLLENSIEPKAFEEVWFVLSKALTTFDNTDAKNVMLVSDFLISNGNNFLYSSCSSYYMNCLLSLLTSKSNEKSVANDSLVSDFCTVIGGWKERFSHYEDRKSIKTITDGINEIEKAGFDISVLIKNDDVSFLPLYSSVLKMKPHAGKDYRADSGLGSDLMAERAGFDPKELYRNIKKLLIQLDEEGDDLFIKPKARDIVLMCKYSQPELQEMINAEVMQGTNEKLVSRLLLVNDKIQQINERFVQFQKKYNYANWTGFDQNITSPNIHDSYQDGEVDEFLAMWVEDDKKDLVSKQSEAVHRQEPPHVVKKLSQVLDLFSSDEETDEDVPIAKVESTKSNRGLLARISSSALWPGSWADQPEVSSPPPDDIRDMMGVELINEVPVYREKKVATQDLLDDLFIVG